MRPAGHLAGALATLMCLTPPAVAQPRKKATAQLLAGAGVGASSALFLSAFLLSPEDGDVNMPLLYAGLSTGVITPSLGHFYVGDYLTVGMGIRAAAAALATYAVLEYRINVRCPGVMFDDSCTSLEHEAIGLLGIAAIAFVGGAAYDLKDLPDAVDRYNADHGFATTPIIIPASGGPVPGVGVVGYF